MRIRFGKKPIKLNGISAYNYLCCEMGYKHNNIIGLLCTLRDEMEWKYIELTDYLIPLAKRFGFLDKYPVSFYKIKFIGKSSLNRIRMRW